MIFGVPLLVPGTTSAAIPAVTDVGGPANPFESSDNSIHEDWHNDYLVEACDDDNYNAMTYNGGGMPVSDDVELLANTGDKLENGCLSGGAISGMSIGGNNGSTSGSNKGVKGSFTLTAPAGTTITGLDYSGSLFDVGADTGKLLSGWYGEIANDSDGLGLVAEHDPTQTYAGFEAGEKPTNDCVSRTPTNCDVSQTGSHIFTFNAEPWTTSTTAAPALQEVGFGFECRGSQCNYDEGRVWADVRSALFQINDPVNDPAAGAASGGGASFDGTGASADSGGWLSASQVGATTFTTASDPGGICTLGVGLYNNSGAPVDVDQDESLEVPAIDPNDGYYTSGRPCSDSGGEATFTYTPNTGVLAKLPSGIYYLNAAASNPADYQQGEYSWYSGGTNTNIDKAFSEGIPVKIDNTQPTVSITPGASGWSDGVETESVTVTGTTGPSGLQALTCTDNAAAATPISTTSGTDTETSTYEVTGVGAHTLACDVTNGVNVTGTGSANIEIDSLTSYGSSPEIDNGQDPYSDGPSQTAWYRGAQLVTVTADKSGGSDISAIDCQGAGLNDDITNNQNSLDESVTISIQPPGGTLTCTAVDAAGDVYPLGSYTFNIDDVAPTGAFAVQDPTNPDLIQVQADSSGAPIASVELTFTCKSGPCLTGNGSGGPYPIQSEKATLNSADGYWEATIPDNGSWPNGDYALGASITDAAGNVGNATKLVNGESAGISLPARVVTTLAATLSGDGKTASTAPNQITPLGEEAAVSSSSRRRDPNAITLEYGAGATIRGRLQDKRGGAAIKHARVVIYQRLITGGGMRKIGSTRTNSNGRFSYHLSPGASRRITIAYDGTTIMHPASGHVIERFRGRVRIQAAGRAIAGQTLVIHGRIYGSDLPSGGLLVQPRSKLKGLGGGWAPFGSAVRTDADGRFTIRIHLARIAAGFTYLLDVRVQSQIGYAYLTTVSETLTRYVRH